MKKYEVGAIYTDQFETCYDGSIINREIFWEGVRANTPEEAERKAAAIHAKAHPDEDISAIKFKCYGLYAPIDEYDRY